MDALDRWIDENLGRLIGELRELCAIPSEATDAAALDRAARWCRERLAAAGARNAREIRVPALANAPALTTGDIGGGRRTLICVQHYDVQPAVPLDLWTSPPYEPTLRDGALYARGVDDNKGHLLLRIHAAELHRAVYGELPIRLRFLIEGEEESGSPHLARLLATEPAVLEADGALKEGGEIDTGGRQLLLLGGKGIFYVELHLRTLERDAHSGNATHLPNAAWRLVSALGTLVDAGGRILIDGWYDDVKPPSALELARVAALPYDAAEMKRVHGIRDFAWNRNDVEARAAAIFAPTCNICGIWSGFTTDGTKTVIPAEASAKIDFRLVPDQDPARLGALLRAHFDRHGFADVEIRAKEGSRPYRGPVDDPLVRAAARVGEEEFGGPSLLIPSSSGTSPMWTVCGPGSLANVTLGMAHPGAGAHAPNEHIRLANYRRTLRATARLYALYATQA